MLSLEPEMETKEFQNSLDQFIVKIIHNLYHARYQANLDGTNFDQLAEE